MKNSHEEIINLILQAGKRTPKRKQTSKAAAETVREKIMFGFIKGVY